MKLTVHHRCDDNAGYRAATVTSLYNIDSGTAFDPDLPVEGFGTRAKFLLAAKPTPLPNESSKTTRNRRR